jgi:hypothetical protein
MRKVEHVARMGQTKNSFVGNLKGRDTGIDGRIILK